MNKEERQAKFEKKWADLFFSLINKKYNLDYQAKSQPSSQQAKDVIGISKNNKHPELRLELTEAKNGVRKK